MAWLDYILNPKKAIREEIEELNKAEGLMQPENISTPGDAIPETPMMPNAPGLAQMVNMEGGDIGRKALLTDPYWETNQSYFLSKQKISRISNKSLKDVSLRDWLVSSIIQARVDTLQRFSRPQQNKFDMGYRVVKRDQQTDLSEAERQEIAAIESFIYNCGRVDGTPVEDQMLFGKFVKLVVRDFLVIGHMAVEKVRTRGGALHRFRPLPAESVFLIDKRASKAQLETELKQAMETYHKPKSDNDPIKAQQKNEADISFFKYIQKSQDGRTLAVFGDEDLIFRLFNPQNFMDLNGYCYSPLELAILNVTNHLNVENYNANFFTHGYAARGILHLKGTVTQSQLISFRKQFYNTINGSQNAWRTPIIAGLDEVDWVPMSGSSKEMEYINFNNHLLRAICTQFQIDPMELGLDYLISANGRVPAGGESNKDKINFSRERGLYPILMFLEDFINQDVIPMINPEFAKKYLFKFDGYTSETPQTEAALLQAEMTIHRSMNDLLKAARKPTLNHIVADLPLNAQFWQLVEKNMTKGEIRETFFGDKDASKRPELQYIPADPMFVGWQQMLMTLNMQKQQMEAQAQTMAAQAQMEQEKHGMEKEKHGMEKEKHQHEVGAIKDQAAMNAVQAGVKPPKIPGPK